MNALPWRIQTASWYVYNDVVYNVYTLAVSIKSWCFTFCIQRCIGKYQGTYQVLRACTRCIQVSYTRQDTCLDTCLYNVVYNVYTLVTNSPLVPCKVNSQFTLQGDFAQGEFVCLRGYKVHSFALYGYIWIYHILYTHRLVYLSTIYKVNSFAYWDTRCIRLPCIPQTYMSIGIPICGCTYRYTYRPYIHIWIYSR